MKTYKDSKEFPLERFERVSTTGNYFFMIKGYEDGDEIKANEAELQELFNLVVQDYVVSLNSRNTEILNHGKINVLKVDLTKFILAKEIIILHLKRSKIQESKNENIYEMLKYLKIQKKTDLFEQIKIIDSKIDKLQNDIEETEKKIEKNNPGNETESDINEIITNVELILERSIDLQKTSLYRFGIMQEQARKKIETLNKQNDRR